MRSPADALLVLVRERADALRALSADLLRTLPACTTEVVTVSGAAIDLTTYRDDLAGGRTRIVAQAYRKRLFGMAGQVAAEGFDVESSGALRRLTAEDLWDYR